MQVERFTAIIQLIPMAAGLQGRYMLTNTDPVNVNEFGNKKYKL
jgi:hypothetical protein